MLPFFPEFDMEYMIEFAYWSNIRLVIYRRKFHKVLEILSSLDGLLFSMKIFKDIPNRLLTYRISSQYHIITDIHFLDKERLSRPITEP